MIINIENIWVVSHTCLRTKWLISISPLAPESVSPIITAFPPSLTLCTHCENVLGFPNASTHVSTPIPPVISCPKIPQYYNLQLSLCMGWACRLWPSSQPMNRLNGNKLKIKGRYRYFDLCNCIFRSSIYNMSGSKQFSYLEFVILYVYSNNLGCTKRACYLQATAIIIYLWSHHKFIIIIMSPQYIKKFKKKWKWNAMCNILVGFCKIS